jgi:hypothetical protein
VSHVLSIMLFVTYSALSYIAYDGRYAVFCLGVASRITYVSFVAFYDCVSDSLPLQPLYYALTVEFGATAPLMPRC